MSALVAVAVSVSFVFGLWSLSETVAVGGLSASVLAVAVLFPVVLSFGDETVAEFVIVRLVPVGVTTTVMLGASVPAARLPPVRLHVTVPETLLQVQFVPVALPNVTPAGSVSTTLTADASSGPPLWTPIV